MKTAIVTGGTRSIGFGISTLLAKNGYNLSIFAVAEKEQVKNVIAELESNGIEVLYYAGNLSNAQNRAEFVEQTVSRFGAIDLLVKVRMDMLETTEESYDFVMDINLKGTFFLTQLVANEMIKTKERNPMIINTSSISAYTSSTLRAEYCLSKAGIAMVTKLFADRLAEYGINVYEIRPGVIKTDMTKAVTEKYDKLITEGLTPIKRWGYPEDVAKAVLAIAQGALPFSTGEVINVDGGFHLRSL